MIVVLIPGLIGVVFIYLGVITLNGRFKRWYLGPRLFPPQALVHAAIPFGFAGIGLSLVGLLASSTGADMAGWLVGIMVLPAIMLGFLLAFWRPKWILPRWVFG